MTVFRGYIKVIKSNRLMICFYLAIFFAFSILFQTTAKSADTEMYQMRGVRIGVINNDDGALAEALVRYLSGIPSSFSSGITPYSPYCITASI